MKQLSMTLVLVLASALELTADTITLGNGDRLTGELQSLSSGELDFETAYAGTVTIQWDHLETISTVGEFSVEFRNGVLLSGPLSSPEAGMVQIGSESPVPFTEIVAIRQDSVLAPEPGILSEWHGTADLGYSVTRGNTEIDNLAITFTPQRRTANDRVRLRTQTLYNVQDGTTASNMHSGRTQYERFLSTRTFFFINGKIETDEREQLDLRTGQGGGFGIRFTPDRQTTISLFGGATFLQERFQGTERQLNAEGSAGFEIETALFEPFVIASRGQILPILSDGRYRIEWDANLRMPLFGGLTLGLQIFDNFDSDPPREEVERNDFGLISTFGVQF